MFFTKKKIYQSLLIGSGLLMGNISNSHAAQLNLPVTMTTNVSMAVMQYPNPTYLLSMANNLQSSEFAWQNRQLVVYLLQQAAKQGSAEAQFQLGSLYLDSDILDKNEDKAIFWLKKAAAQDHASAQFVYDQLMNFDYGIGC